MKSIYSMNLSFNFIIQATRVLNNNDYNEDELKMIFDYLISLENETLIDYHNTCSIISYENDLELYVEILDAMIKIFEDREEYEKCQKLKIKKEESIIIMKSKTI